MTQVKTAKDGARIDAKCSSKSKPTPKPKTLTYWRKKALILQELKRLAGPAICNQVHHTKLHRHGWSEDCPIEARYNELEQQLYEMDQ